MKYRKTKNQIAKSISIKDLESGRLSQSLPTDSPLSIDQLISLEQSITGKLVFPWNPDYEQDRKDFNDVYPACPVVIVYAVCFDDLRECLKIAQDNGLQFTIRSGGHSLAGYSVCDGMVIDMSMMKHVHVDVTSQTLTVDAGAAFGDIFPILEQYGLHMPGGGCPTVCVAGYMQGGGYGLTSRAFGMNCDCVLEVMVMLADGRIVKANQNLNSDLFWAVRGGTGGNFGILLNIKYQLVPLGFIWGIKITWNIDPSPGDAAQALYTIQEQYLTDNAFANLGIETILATDTDGKKKVFFCAVWIGDEAGFDMALAPLLDVPGAQVVFKIQGKYSDVNARVLEGTPDLPEGIKAYSRSTIIERSLSIANWSDILQYFLTAPNQYTMVDMECYGGKINQVSPGYNAFIHRTAKMDFFCDAFFDDQTKDQKENEIWLNAFMTFMQRYSNGHSYQNYPNRDQQNWKWAYWGNFYDQLLSVKQKYDPANAFNYPQSIGPYQSISRQNLITQSPIQYEAI
ncbi:MAG: FAD-binding oxidoreductase [Saprospiraceae bacterium]|nr:FAD-binding oxidoreductase [Saprospiraceae bacterium]MBK9930770.1 FAD-binding oxidoreductase [Saprospiraceae bacterium]